MIANFCASSSLFMNFFCVFVKRRILRRQFTNQNEIVPIKMSFRVADSKQPVEKHASPIIIMHGLLGSKNNWNTLAKTIGNKTNRKVIILDARNHGDSPHSDEFSYPILAEDVKYFLLDENIPKAHVLGHSMGGRAMMYLALAYPHLVSSLLVVDISPIGTSPTMGRMIELFDAMKSIDLKAMSDKTLPVVRKIADAKISHAVDDMGVRQFILTNLRQRDKDSGVVWQCNVDALQKQFFNHMINFPLPSSRTYSGPTYFIGGGKSDFIKHEDHPGIRKLFPNSEISYIKNAGHWVHSQYPELFVNKVTSFYNNLPL